MSSRTIAMTFACVSVLSQMTFAQLSVAEESAVPKEAQSASQTSSALNLKVGSLRVKADKQDGAMTPLLKLEDLVGLAISTHPGVSAKRANFYAMQAEEQTARWQYFPTPAFSNRTYEKADMLNRTGTMSFSLQQPIWTGGRLSAGLEKASSQTRSAYISIIETQHEVAVNITAVYQSWLQATGRVEALSQSVLFHEDQVESMKRRFAGGVSPEVDLTLVKARLMQAQSDLAASQSDQRDALSKLSQLVGRSLTSEEIDLPTDDVADPPALENLVKKADAIYPVLRRIEADIDAAQSDVELKRASLWPTVNLRVESNRYTQLTAPKSLTDNLIMLTIEHNIGAGFSVMSAIDASTARLIGLRETHESARRDMINRIYNDHEDYTSGLARRISILVTRKSAKEILDS